MKFSAMMGLVVSISLSFCVGFAFAGNGDLIINGNLGVGTQNPAAKAEVNGNMVIDGNLGVGTTTPSEKAEVNGNLKVNGNLQTNGNLCVGGNCTNSLHISGGVYGYCQGWGGSGLCTSTYQILPPASCIPQYGLTLTYCACPSEYTRVQVGTATTVTSSGTTITVATFACYKN